MVRLDPRRRDVHTLADAVTDALAGPPPHPLALAPGGRPAAAARTAPRTAPSCPPTAIDDLAASLDPDDDLARAEAVFAWVTDTTDAGHDPRRTSSARPGRTGSTAGSPPRSSARSIFLAVMWAVFALTTTVAAPLQGALDAFFTGPVTVR